MFIHVYPCLSMFILITSDHHPQSTSSPEMLRKSHMTRFALLRGDPRAGETAVEPHNAAVVEIETTKIMETNLENPTWLLAPS